MYRILDRPIVGIFVDKDVIVGVATITGKGCFPLVRIELMNQQPLIAH